MEKSVKEIKLILESKNHHISEKPVVIDKCGCDTITFEAVIHFGKDDFDRIGTNILKWFKNCMVDYAKKQDVCDDIEVTYGDMYMKVFNAFPVAFNREMRTLQVRGDWINTCDIFLGIK